jgi:hypothetical protein
MIEEILRDQVLGSGGITMDEQVQVLIVIDNRHGQANELLIALGEVLLAVIGTGHDGTGTNRALVVSARLLLLSGPAAFRALHTIADAGN